MVSKNQAYELESLLFEVKERGFIEINKYKVWRLLGKGSNAPGTWKALLDAWEELGSSFKRSELHGSELPSGNFVLTTVFSEPVAKWAGESI